jgi:predicted dehydrogenase
LILLPLNVYWQPIDHQFWHIGEILNNMNVALIGCGRWGKNIARALHKVGALKRIIEQGAPGIQDFASELGVEVSDDMERAFQSDVRAVAIAVPAMLHFEVCKRALMAGKHVFVEKPLALQISQAEELAELAESKKLTLMVGHLLQYHPAFIKLNEVIATGAVGQVRHISSSRINPGAIRSEENALWSFAPHDFSMILKLAGQTPSKVEALAVKVLNPEIPDQFLVQIRFDGALTASANVSWLGPFKEHKLVVLGTSGAIVFEDTAPDPDRKLVLYRDYVDLTGPVPVFVKSKGESIACPNAEPLLEEMRHFIDCAAGKAVSRTGPHEAIPVLKLLRAASDAAGLPD